MSTQLCYIANDLDRQEQSLLDGTATFPDAILCIGLDPGVHPFENTYWLWCSSLSWLGSGTERGASVSINSVQDQVAAEPAYRLGPGHPLRARLRRPMAMFSLHYCSRSYPRRPGGRYWYILRPPPPQASSDDLWLHGSSVHTQRAYRADIARFREAKRSCARCRRAWSLMSAPPGQHSVLYYTVYGGCGAACW